MDIAATLRSPLKGAWLCKQLRRLGLSPFEERPYFLLGSKPHWLGKPTGTYRWLLKHRNPQFQHKCSLSFLTSPF